MEDLYKILELNSTASASELKKSYQELALRFHPDKVAQGTTAAGTEKFIKVNRAYKILCDPELREQYDIKWRERCLAQTYPIQDTVEFDEFEEIENEIENIGAKSDISDSVEMKTNNGGNPSKLCQYQSKGGNSYSADDSNSLLQGSKGDHSEVVDQNTIEELSANTPHKELVYMYECRCGGNYVLTQVDVKLSMDIVCCDTCSLSIQVIYPDT